MAVWAIAGVSMPDPSALLRPGSGRVGTLGDAWRIVARNCLVLALHAMACVAGFIAGSSLPLQAATQSGRVRWIHERAGPLAIAFVIAATGFSLVTQAWVLGVGTSILAAQLHTSPGVLLLALSPHAVLELTALFLPLAAWIAASRRHAWNQLLAATFATVGLAVPMLILAALIEVVRITPLRQRPDAVTSGPVHALQAPREGSAPRRCRPRAQVTGPARCQSRPAQAPPATRRPAPGAPIAR